MTIANSVRYVVAAAVIASDPSDLGQELVPAGFRVPSLTPRGIAAPACVDEVESVFHTAAYKPVFLMAWHPLEAAHTCHGEIRIHVDILILEDSSVDCLAALPWLRPLERLASWGRDQEVIEHIQQTVLESLASSRW